jgi:hypothetical protein
VDSNDNAAGESKRHASMDMPAAGSSLPPFALPPLPFAPAGMPVGPGVAAWLGSLPPATACTVLDLPFFLDVDLLSGSESALLEAASTELMGEVSEGSLMYG